MRGCCSYRLRQRWQNGPLFTNGAKLPELKKTTRAYYNCLLHNNGDGTFVDVTAKAGLGGASIGYSFGVAAADFDNDGFDDLFICNAGMNTLYHNNGDGTFTDVTAGSGVDRKPADVLSVGAAWFDYDNDGLLDLIVTNYTTWTPQTDRQCFMDSKQEEYCQSNDIQEHRIEALSQPRPRAL